MSAATAETVSTHSTVREDPLITFSRLRWHDGGSRAIRCFAYRDHTLYVAFSGAKTAERGYAYSDVSLYQYLRFRLATSRGRYFARNIKPNRVCTPFEVVTHETQVWERKRSEDRESIPV
jgi:hypothetical protein